VPFANSRHIISLEDDSGLAPYGHPPALTAGVIAAYDINYYFPLYLHPDSDRRDLFSYTQRSPHTLKVNGLMAKTNLFVPLTAAGFMPCAQTVDAASRRELTRSLYRG
jgi:hypothetical protein